MKLNIYGVTALLMGIGFGVIVTIQFNKYITVVQPLGNNGNDVFTSNTLLEEEKALLLSRLDEINMQLGLKDLKLVNTTSDTGVSHKIIPVTTSNNLKLNEIPLKDENKHEKSCPYSFKVYVYDIPQSLGVVKISEEARANKTLHLCPKPCIFEQFSLEYIMLDFFSNFCGRTRNAEEADFFYLPIVRDAEFRWAMEKRVRNSRAPSAAEQALLDIMEKNDSSRWKEVFQVSDQYWHRRGGGDHILVMPAPVTNLRHESSQRGYFHYMMHLHTPIFLNVEYSVDFVKEYPVCSTQKNIVMPYPTIDPDLFSGKLLLAAKDIPRTSLLYYAGGMHGDCVEVRKAMKFVMVNSSRLTGMNVVPTSVRSTVGDREHGFLAATFCPIPVGDSPSSKRMYDVLNFGCIPVILSDDLIWAYSDQSGGALNHSHFSFQMPQSVVHFTAQKTLRRFGDNKAALGVLPFTGVLLYDLLEQSVREGGDYKTINGAAHYINPLVQILLKVPKDDVTYLQQNIQKAAPVYRYYSMNATLTHIPLTTHLMPDGGAVDALADLLAQRKQYGLDRLREECVSERGRKTHKYVSRYACDSDKTDSLVKRNRFLFR